MRTVKSIGLWGWLTLILLAILMLVPVSDVSGFSSFLTPWRGLYPNSLSDDNVIGGNNASCQLCHASANSGSGFNAYGADLKEALKQYDISVAMQMIEAANSDGDTIGFTNLEEINANTQPGWTMGGPTNIGLLDPAPAADPDIDIQPLMLDFGAVTTGLTDTRRASISNFGDADLTVMNLALTGSADFFLNLSTPGAPFTVTPGSTAFVSVDYAPLEPGDDAGSLVVSSDDPDEPDVLIALAGTGVPPVGACDIDVSPMTLALEYGVVEVGTTASLSATVGNSGTTDCIVSSITVGGTDFALNPAAPFVPFTVAPMQTVDVQVDYAPLNEGDDAGILVINSDDSDEPVVSVSLSGTGVLPAICDIDVSPLTLAYGSVEIGSTAILSATVGNTGTAVCVIDSLLITGSSFSLAPGAPGLPVSVPPNEMLDLPVTYMPTGEGDDTGSLEIGNSDPDESMISVALRGTGVAAPVCDINVLPPTLDYGSVEVGNVKTLSATIGNTGSADCEVSSLVVAGADFELNAGAPPIPFTVQPMGSVEVPVDYTPSDVGGDAGSLEIGGNDPAEPVVSVALNGNGTPVPVCDIVVLPLNLDYGSIEVGTTKTLAVTIGNTGSASCVVSALAIMGTDFALGAGAPAIPFSVAPSGAVEVPVDYMPVDPGNDTGTLSIGNGDPDESAISIGLSGNAAPAPECDIDVSPLMLDFGAVTMGMTDTLQTTITNTGSADCMVSSLTIGGSADFNLDPVAPTPAFILQPGESEDVPVGYSPSDSGDDSGTLDIGSNDPDEPAVSVALSGTGVPAAQECDVSVTPLTLEFGMIEVGTTGTLSVTVENAGSAECVLSALMVTGTDFALSLGAPSLPLTISPTESVLVPVDYTPSDVGDDSGTLDVDSNDPDELAVSVSLAGRGFDPSTGGVDLDIERFKVKKEVKLHGDGDDDDDDDDFDEDRKGSAIVTIKLLVRNTGRVNEPRPATVTGVQNGLVVYNETLLVFDAIGDGRITSFKFPPFTPDRVGVIEWMVTISDDDPDDDTATAVTNVKGKSRGNGTFGGQSKGGIGDN